MYSVVTIGAFTITNGDPVWIAAVGYRIDGPQLIASVF